MSYKKVSTVIRTAAIIAVSFVVVTCATFKGEIPVGLDIADTVYISPKNADGIQDQLVIDLAIPELKNLVIQGYRFSILAVDGTEDTDPVYFVEEIANKRMQRKGLSIPESLVWDGVDLGGASVPDGEYLYTVEAWDRHENRGKTLPKYVVVDNTPPSVDVFTSYPILSPNADGVNDTLRISQSNSSVEQAWRGEIRSDGGEILQEFDWAGIARDFDWDGQDKGGKTVADGLYVYTVQSTDLAGNTASFSLKDISVDTVPKKLSLSIAADTFSPNGDGRRDLLRFFPVIGVSRDLDRWTLDIANARGEVVRSFSGAAPVPAEVIFDGRDAQGAVLPDGRHRGVLSLVYRSGEMPTAASPPFLIDNTRPIVTLSADYTLFSPDGDGNRDVVAINQSSSVEDLWRGSIRDASGQSILSLSWRNRAVQFTWDGKNSSGQQVPDGTYSYRITSTDGAENTTVTELQNIRVDTRQTPISIKTAAASFSPNGDGFFDSLPFTISADVADELKLWTLLIVGSDQKVRKTLTGGALTGKVPETISWDGRNEQGKIEEGTYTASMTAEYLKGNISQAGSDPFLLDVSGPTIQLRIIPQPFSPDGDGIDDTVSISFDLEDANPIGEWSARILDPMGTPFRSFSGKGPLQAPLIWNGRSDKDELVQSASDYRLELTVRDSLRNAARSENPIPVDILVIRDGERLKIIISSIYFKAFTADYLALEPDQVKRNLVTLDRLAEILKKYSGYKIQIAGYAVRIYWFDPLRLKTEEDEVLLPLSRERAEVIKQALVQRGISENRMTSAGYGGNQPVVPHSDLANRWKNRRVEFILIKE